MTFTGLTYEEQRALMIYALGSEFECERRLRACLYNLRYYGKIEVWNRKEKNAGDIRAM